MNPITIIILNKGNKLDNTIQSFSLLNPQQTLLGSYTPLAHKNVINFQNFISYDKVLNELQDLAPTDWVLYLKDNEIILNFEEYLPNLLSNNKEVYGFQVLQDEVIVKEPRLWNKKERKVVFKNPIFEHPSVDITKVADVTLYQQKVTDIKTSIILESWKKSAPLSVDVAYYTAFEHLARKEFVEFKRLIIQYLFNVQKNDIPGTMARYYLAFVQGLVQNQAKEAVQNIVLCIATNPLMAEFWCLLGDIFLSLNEYEKAIAFYENAIALGSRRPKFDLWPTHISKYSVYPQEMIAKCKNTIKNTFKANPNY